MRSATIDIFDEVDRQLVAFAYAGAPPVKVHPPRAHPPTVPITEDAPLPFVLAPSIVPQIPTVTSRPADAPPTLPRPDRFRQSNAAIVAGLVVAALTLGLLAALILHLIAGRETLTERAAVESIVARILVAESHGKIDARSKRSTATGPAQFIDDTWLDMIRAFRPDLAKDRTRDQLLDLRHNPELAREMATRFAERNAALLSRRQLPVTAASIYLAHFAGAGGAAALLSAPADADAAKVMAEADATGKTKREQIARANPFLDKFTVADILRWAERKMDGPRLVLTAPLTPPK